MFSFWNKGKDDSRKIPYMSEIKKVHEYHKKIEGKNQGELIALVEELRNGEVAVKDKKIQAYAIIHEVIKRTLGMTPFDVQIAGGIALREGNIAQMRTGEGKTITALFPAFWGYVDNQQTYVITVNEYLAERDCLQARKVFDYLNITVGLILKDFIHIQKIAEYRNPIVYTTNTEFAFDYLRDNLATQAEHLMQGRFDFAIIDEADLVLIDEAKSPVIIAGKSVNDNDKITKAKNFIKTLGEEEYEIDETYHIPILTDEGFERGESYFGMEITEDNELYNAVNQALFARFKMKKDVDYIVRDEKVHIVDRYTGRVLSGRRFQNGLHQAIEAKENVPIEDESQVFATTTYQSLFRKFKKTSGMTGTGIESREEFRNIYRMDVEVIPTNKPVLREDKQDILFATKKEKYNFLIEMIKEKRSKGQPILIGTVSVVESEEVSEALSNASIPFRLLNAKNDKEEVEIVEQAGKYGVVTISTNMAGRGTDIKIAPEIEALGGLCVIGVSRNESKRIDRQLRGRSGRQGQVGESIYLSSLEDELIVLHPGNKLEKFKKKNKIYPVTTKIAEKLVDDIQRAVEGNHAALRKLQFQMDDILHYQREYVYQMRRSLLTEGVTQETVLNKAKEAVLNMLFPFAEESSYVEEWDFFALEKVLLEKIGVKVKFPEKISERSELTKRDVENMIFSEIKNSIERTVSEVGEEAFSTVIGKHLAMQTIDEYWMCFLQEVELYKVGFGLSSYGEQDPIRKFSMDMDSMFKNIMQEALMNLTYRFMTFESKPTETEQTIVIDVPDAI